MNNKRITVIGAGVTGLSIAVLLRSLGYEVNILAERFIDDEDAWSDPRFASAYAAASVIPHSIGGENIGGLLDFSDSIFQTLAQKKDSGVRSQRHMEIWEIARPSPPPEYLQDLNNVRSLAESDDVLVPQLDVGKQVSGWSFDIWFADMPLYGPWLTKFAKKIGCESSRRRIRSLEDLSLLDTDVIVNATGAGSNQLFKQFGQYHFVRGMLLVYPVDDLWTEVRSGSPVSYNYTPTMDVYDSDVYFYPRESSLVFGGSRRIGRPSTDGSIVWEGDGGPSDQRQMVDDLAEINDKLVTQLTGNRPGLLKRPDIMVGYRHLMGLPDHPRYQISRDEDSLPNKTVVHCAGFGGAGVTLSWGAAAQAVSQVRAIVEADESPVDVDEIGRLLADQLL